MQLVRVPHSSTTRRIAVQVQGATHRVLVLSLVRCLILLWDWWHSHFDLPVQRLKLCDVGATLRQDVPCLLAHERDERPDLSGLSSPWNATIVPPLAYYRPVRAIDLDKVIVSNQRRHWFANLKLCQFFRRLIGSSLSTVEVLDSRTLLPLSYCFGTR